MTVSDWCFAWGGARPKCAECKAPTCTHECHEKPVVERESRLSSGRLGAQVKTAPGGALTPESQGLADERSVD